uniref:NADH-ubiquinone oxidoreductase chain 1 n=1 Tax=Oltmannsiellopsis viridis TaxID=51324 RepID=Q0QIN5_OLTVI|nr:NADH dehydrogenase subunit 1 [Oltmannsiellopsis viridis]ABC96369.1 NADH dehydrogenase subunit 1 [Oltmannsiellopsis viridis]
MSISFILLKLLALTVPALVGIAYFTLAERKIMASIQRRRGPNVVGIFGILQPLSDGLKLLVKEPLLPNDANLAIYFFAPVLTFLLSQVFWAVIPFDEGAVLADIDVGLLYIFAISSLGIYGVITSGWSSNSKYAFLGAMRATAQMVSYEVSIGLILMTVLLCVGSLNLTEIVLAQKSVWFAVPLFPSLIMFFISCLAETNRAPFDLVEGESEIVAGYFIEYSSMGFALFFLAEYNSMIVMCCLCTILFLGGWLSPLDIALFNWVPGPIWFALKSLIFIFLFVHVRAALPRMRYDALMRVGWKNLLPLSLAYVILTAGILVSFDLLP